jgi:hypothetical protein
MPNSSPDRYHSILAGSVKSIDEDTEKILGLLDDLSGILIPYIYTILYTACKEEFSCENSS